jgi:serine/threonine protein kinase
MSCEGVYSPQSCDIWSLGIMLINIVTGRNPWNCAKWEDAAFRCYHQNPSHYFPTVLPISAELNEVLIMMLCMEWRARPAIAEIRDAVRRIPSFYSRDAVFDGSVAKYLREGDRYKRPVAHRVDLGDASRPGRTREQNPGNHLRTRIIKERFPLFEEGDSDDSRRDSDSSSSPSSLSSTLGSARSSPAPSLDKRLKLRSKTTSFGSILVGIQGLFGIFPSLGRGKKGRVGHVV